MIHEPIKPLPLPERLEIRGKRLRLRYLCAGVLGLIALGFILSLVPDDFMTGDSNQVSSSNILESLSEQKEPFLPLGLIAGDDKVIDVVANESAINLPQTISADTPAKILPYPYKEVLFPGIKPDERRWASTLRSGDTLISFLGRNGVGATQAYEITQAFKKVFNPRDLKTGDMFKLDLMRDNDTTKLVSLDYQPSLVETITVARNADDQFIASKAKTKIITVQGAADFNIENSLYGSALKAGLNDAAIMDLIYLFSFKIDFQRDVRSGDNIKALYERDETEDGRPVGDSRILYASMRSSGKDITIYRYEERKGDVDFFTADGRSIRQGLLRTPIAFGRVSSGYGMRRHPIAGYNKMHKGIDFAAPTGTAIFAAADGVVEKRYYSSSFGNYIRIRHASGIKTAYAHMSRFHKNVKNGTRVKQGQTIGYVGSTGRSTGPHLHYEVHKNDRQVNPRNVNLPTQNELTGQKLKTFKAHVRKLKSEFEKQAKNRSANLASQE